MNFVILSDDLQLIDLVVTFKDQKRILSKVQNQWCVTSHSETINRSISSILFLNLHVILMLKTHPPPLQIFYKFQIVCPCLITTLTLYSFPRFD